MLRPIQDLFPPQQSPNLVVGLDSPDDAAVWRLDSARLLVVTTDFFTPVVDDPYDFGAIAAANSLSDLYAMGAVPFLALNVAAMPTDLDPDVVREILRGGAEMARAAGAVIAGGHTVQDKEPKYGLVALGMAQEERLMTKGGARPGDALLLTKPLGIGVTATALKKGKADANDVSLSVSWMKRLNAEASRIALEADVRGGTDVTGFGLLGHATEMAAASRSRLRIHLDTVPFLVGALKYARAGFFPSGSRDNERYFAPQVQFAQAIGGIERSLLFDSQTSGGLLLSVPRHQMSTIAAAALRSGMPIWWIGEVVEGQGVEVTAAAPADWSRPTGEVEGVVLLVAG